MKKRYKGQSRIISWGVYPFDVLVTTEDYETTVRGIERTGYKLNEEEKRALEMSGVGRTVMLKNGAIVIRLLMPPKTPKQIGTVAHEAFHATCFLFERIGIKFGHKSDEAFAYAIDYLTTEILEFFKAGK